PVPALLQPQDETRGARPPRRRTAGPDPRPAAAGPGPLPVRDRADPPAGEEPGRQDPGQQRNLPSGALPLAGTLRRPRRARPARAPDPAPVPPLSLCLMTVSRLAPEPRGSCDFRLRRPVSCFYRS